MIITKCIMMKVAFDDIRDTFLVFNIVVVCLTGVSVSYKHGRKNKNDRMGSELVTFSV